MHIQIVSQLQMFEIIISILILLIFLKVLARRRFADRKRNSRREHMFENFLNASWNDKCLRERLPDEKLHSRHLPDWHTILHLKSSHSQ
ncbi:unnamed protein product [Hymenolepis diminuta]|uniref:Uncharacterized protein n=1 Tax=Hymenolepis diminuta TaxID=6216 RepID=A0A564XWX1_HYMDI|nr:unnamed protein product [Hymenolepis diminuta]